MSDFADLLERLPQLMLRDHQRLQRRVETAQRVRRPASRQAIVEEIASEVAAAERRLARRAAAVPSISYPPVLPISQRKDDILAAIRDHQVVIVAGETGSGKTTQLPKICLELGRGVQALIGHTQPRRLAARTVADRIAEELGTPVGAAVGYKMRFSERVSDDTLVKLMTDGILLAEIQSDRLLHTYDTLIIDEAHERSLNIDFILGYLKQLLPRRPDLKIVITSATIDPERFSRHFHDAPVINVSGRVYPVEVRYRPVVEDADDADRDEVAAICDAVDELCTEGPGDILVFLSGEREIRDTADALRKARPKDTEVLPLYARLSAAEQHRVFQPHPGRRIVLATNVAETSLTVPGIRYVVDPGNARISRYSRRLKVQRLPIESISQASANQRIGRCGRVSDGIGIRLYSEQDFLSRPEFTDPEILRTNLAAVILQMTALDLGDVAAFPFVEPPDRRSVKDGMQLLEELGAFDPAQSDPRRRLTRLGRKLAQLPLDPRFGRMVLEADRNGCLREVLVIAAALSIQDPRERPADKQQAAAEKHNRFADEESDFLAFLNLWDYISERQQAFSSSQFRRLCRTEFLHYLRIREWQDLFAQLRQIVRGLGLTLNTTPADRDRIHISLLAGLLSHLGLKDPETQEYVGARNARFAINPGSVLFRKRPRWVMAAELVETTRLWARCVARIEPEWAEQLGAHLVKRGYSEPHWERRRDAVVAHERVTLYGVPLVASRKVSYGSIDRELCRELFIRHALVQGDWDTHHAFFHDNRRMLEDLEDLEHRVRRRDMLVDDETLFDFFNERVGPDVVSGRHFDSWWKNARRERPELLTFPASLLATQDGDVSHQDYPDDWRQGDVVLPLTYQFEPGAQNDGVTVHVPLAALNRLSPEGFDWQVPGLRLDLVTALIKSLPKSVRRAFVPAPDHAAAVLKRVTPRTEPLIHAVGRELHRITGVDVPRGAWDLQRVPDHLRMTFRVVDDEGRGVAEGKDLEALKVRLWPQLQERISRAAGDVEQAGLRTWTVGTLPRTFLRAGVDGPTVQGYPALVDEGETVAVRVLGSEAEQQQAMWQGTRRLLLLNVASPVRSIHGRLTNETKLALSHYPHGSAAALFDDCIACAADKLIAESGGPAWDEEGFTRLQDRVRAGLGDVAFDAVTVVARILGTADGVERRVQDSRSPALVPALTDIRAQLSGLVFPGFATATGYQQLPDVLRYLRAVERRLDKLPDNPQRDRELMQSVQRVQHAYRELLDELPPGTPPPPAWQDIRWMIEELRVSYFAQTLRTAHPVSEKRIFRAMDDLAPL